MRFDLDRLPTDPVLLQKMLREMAEVMELDRAELGAAKQAVKAQGLTIEKLEHRLARLLRIQFGRSSEKMDIAQLRMMFEEVDAPEPANDDATMASDAKPTRKAGTRAPIPAHIPRQTTQHLPQPCGCGGNETVICEDVSEVLDYVPACFRVLRHVRPRIACRSCETIRQAPAIDLPLPKVMASSALLAHLVVSRFVDHQPWHRQSVILRRRGVEIDRDVMGRWSRKLAWLMAPLGERLALPKLAALRPWLQAQMQGLSSDSALAKACRYPLNRWAAMVRYCENGLLEISNNLVENALRGVALGRRNWMFVGPPRAGMPRRYFTRLPKHAA